MEMGRGGGGKRGGEGRGRGDRKGDEEERGGGGLIKKKRGKECDRPREEEDNPVINRKEHVDMRKKRER